MTTIDIIPNRRNKRSYYYDQHSLGSQELAEQITCLQRSVANLRKDIPELVAKKLLEMKSKHLGQEGFK